MATIPSSTARIWHRIAAGLLLLAGPSEPLWAQPAISSEQISFEARTLRGAGPTIAGIGYAATTLIYAGLGSAATIVIGYQWRSALWHQ
jgi:hypothetical protein